MVKKVNVNKKCFLLQEKEGERGYKKRVSKLVRISLVIEIPPSSPGEEIMSARHS